MILSKYLFIIRHGHAGFESQSDKQRQLTKKGNAAVINTANFIKEKLTDYNLSVDLALSSDAIRTQQTTEVICKQIRVNSREFCSSLYSTVASTWMDKIIHSEAETLLLIGHNPTLSQLVNQLTGSQCYMKPSECAFINLQIKDNELILPSKLLGYYSSE